MLLFILFFIIIGQSDSQTTGTDSYCIEIYRDCLGGGCLGELADCEARFEANRTSELEQLQVIEDAADKDNEADDETPSQESTEIIEKTLLE